MGTTLNPGDQAAIEVRGKLKLNIKMSREEL